MKSLHKIFLIVALALFSNSAIGQATVNSNIGSSGDFLGWAGSVSQNLEIRNDNPNDIDFIVPGNPFNTSIIQEGLEVGYSVNLIGTSEVSIGFMSANDQHGLRAANDFLIGSLGVPQAIGGAFAVRASAFSSIGVWGECTSISSNENVAIDAYVCTTEGESNAVYGEGRTDNLTTQVWAGFFEGDVYRDAAWNVSDETLKENISLFSESTALLMQLNPVSYEFRVNEYENLRLPGGTHYGFITQEVEPIIPEITKTVITPTDYDYEGNVEHSSMEIEALNYTGIIPLIVGTLNERQVLIDQQVAAIAELEEAIDLLEAQLAE